MRFRITFPFGGSVEQQSAKYANTTYINMCDVRTLKIRRNQLNWIEVNGCGLCCRPWKWSTISHKTQLKCDIFVFNTVQHNGNSISLMRKDDTCLGLFIYFLSSFSAMLLFLWFNVHVHWMKPVFLLLVFPVSLFDLLDFKVSLTVWFSFMWFVFCMLQSMDVLYLVCQDCSHNTFSVHVLFILSVVRHKRSMHMCIPQLFSLFRVFHPFTQKKNSIKVIDFNENVCVGTWCSNALLW